MREFSESKIGIVGLGYVGLPLAVEFGKQFATLGFDVNSQRISELSSGEDKTKEVPAEELRDTQYLEFSSDPSDMSDCNIFIVTVPTPIDKHKRPDLHPLEEASKMIGRALSEGDVVIYESTVYPGATEEVCVPILESQSGLKYNIGFYAGYSPERINPGDKEHRLPTIKKVTSGSTPEITDYVDALYRTVITAGTHKCTSIRVAEAAKVIENTQRDVNIALINELAILFNQLGLDTKEILEAAGSKWNFLPFRPGLVGGHCIGVDPYYLTHKAQEIGVHTEMILAGRRINDNMGAYVTERVVKLMNKKRIHVSKSKVLILGLAFKENCPDLRNTRVIDMIHELEGYYAEVEIYDPWVDPREAKRELGIDLIQTLNTQSYDAIILAVAHQEFVSMGIDAIRALGKPVAVVFDVKYMFPRNTVDDYL